MALPIKSNVLNFVPSARQADNPRVYQTGTQNNNESILDDFDIKLPALINAPTTGTKIISQTFEQIEPNKFRKTQIFEQGDGRTFSKLEEIVFLQNSTRKSVVQQNPSGSISQYEEILDKKSDGTYRRTQIFQDGTGDISTQITPSYKPQDPFILTGGQSGFLATPQTFQTLRGTQLDLSA